MSINISIEEFHQTLNLPYLGPLLKKGHIVKYPNHQFEPHSYSILLHYGFTTFSITIIIVSI